MIQTVKQELLYAKQWANY